MSPAVHVHPRYRVVAVPPPCDSIPFDAWGVVEQHGSSIRPIVGADGKPLAFYSFSEAARWADEDD
ncbi:hypothetical protein HUT16_02410 [Kitasatospora sp. NA04385]|uniref:hypothetical protein n=1 Tax=Kitasatospora sp. NA04385 TaxID=2742135 RepID=UPI001592514E|nr:hypothetical protein [Kitasatospora sp. NA04385]QKW18067.1 hypothetical protein HUT16_02410 [Kitasatospora sp. NA04385]